MFTFALRFLLSQHGDFNLDTFNASGEIWTGTGVECERERCCRSTSPLAGTLIVPFDRYRFRLRGQTGWKTSG